MYNDKVHSYKHSVSAMCQYSTVTVTVTRNGAKMTFSLAFHKCNQPLKQQDIIYMCQTEGNQTQYLVWSVFQSASRCHMGAGTPNSSQWTSPPAPMKTSNCTRSSGHKQRRTRYWPADARTAIYPSSSCCDKLYKCWCISPMARPENGYLQDTPHPHCTQMERFPTSSRGKKNRIIFTIDGCWIFSLFFLQCGALEVDFCFIQEWALIPDFSWGMFFNWWHPPTSILILRQIQCCQLHNEWKGVYRAGRWLPHLPHKMRNSCSKQPAKTRTQKLQNQWKELFCKG